MILTGFACFVVLAISIPLSIRYAIRYATISQQARLEPTFGMLQLYASASSEPIAITSARDNIEEGNRIVAGAGSTQGTLGLVTTESGEVLGSVQLYTGSQLDILQIRRPFFASSPEPYQVRLRLEKGKAQIFTNTSFSNSSQQRPVQVTLETPHGLVQLRAGSYLVWVDANQTNVTVREGQAVMKRNDEARSIGVAAGLHGWMRYDMLAEQPVSAEQNLVQNSSFNAKSLEIWPSYVRADEGIAPGKVVFDNREGRSVAYFLRQGEDEFHNEVGVTQQIGRDVNGYTVLSLQLDVNVLFHNLSGAGQVGTEFPVRVEIDYTDIYGKDLKWGHGFYYRDPEGSNARINFGTGENAGDKVVQATWYHYESPNLFEVLKETRPARINGIRIYGSGWNYQSMVSEVILLVQ